MKSGSQGNKCAVAYALSSVRLEGRNTAYSSTIPV